VTNAGSTRIVTVDMIKGTFSGGELKGALPAMVESARDSGVQVLQINASFANDRLGALVFRQATRMGGTVSSHGGAETITFVLDP
jgi:hypothetical protein